MNKPTDFARSLADYFTNYMAGQRNLSVNTIRSYRDTFCLLLTYLEEEQNCSPEKVQLSKLTDQTINEFMAWLEDKRRNSISTRNQRLAAIHAFFQYLQLDRPDMLLQCQKILSIRMKKHEKAVVNYLSEDSLKNLLTKPDQTTTYGRRDAALLCVLYDTGARVQELIDLSVRDVRIDGPSVIRLTGKGRKTRTVPILHQTAEILKCYMERHGLNPQRNPDQALFCNHQGNRLTRPGVTYILKKYANELQADGNISNAMVTPHVMRHTKAMHLLRADVDLHYIRDFLGHIDISTTEIYAKADAEMKRAAFEKANIGISTDKVTSWQKNDDLMSWLTSLGQDK